MPREESQDLASESFIRQQLHGKETSAFSKYRSLVTGQPGLLSFIRYELVTSLLGPLPGALGLVLRKIFYPSLFREVGKGLVVGRNVTVRHADRITLGKGVVIDDNCVIDARGAGGEGISIGDEVILGRGSTVQSKSGPVRIGKRCNIGGGTSIISMGAIEIGSAVLIAGGCYVSGGVVHSERTDIPIAEQGMFTRGPVVIEDDVSLGMGVRVLDAVRIGKGCVVGSGAIVQADLSEYTNAVPHQRLMLLARERTAENKDTGER